MCSPTAEQDLFHGSFRLNIKNMTIVLAFINTA